MVLMPSGESISSLPVVLLLPESGLLPSGSPDSPTEGLPGVTPLPEGGFSDGPLSAMVMVILAWAVSPSLSAMPYSKTSVAFSGPVPLRS